MSNSSVQSSHYLPENSVGPHRLKGWAPQRLPLQLKQQVPRLPATSSDLAASWRFLRPSSWVRLVCLSSSQNSRKHLLAFTCLLKLVLEDSDEQPDEEVQSLREPWGQQLLSRGSGVHSLPKWVCSLSSKCSVLPTLGILWRRIHVSMINYINSTSNSSVFYRWIGERGAEIKIPSY